MARRTHVTAVVLADLVDKSSQQIPVLAGWMAFPAACARLGVSRQRLFQMKGEGKLRSVHKILGAADRPALYVVAEAEVEKLLREQRKADEKARPEAVTR
jgi:choline dehydrogenase-like flavoprotein